MRNDTVVGGLQFLGELEVRLRVIPLSRTWEDIQRKRGITNCRRELTIEELRKVCQAATGELQLLLALGIYTGLRLGDCATLRWAETDLARGVIRRIPNKTPRWSARSWTRRD